MKKIISLIILCVIICTSLISCDNDREYDEAEVLSSAYTLIEKSHKLNELLYGSGLEFTNDGGVGKYRLATEESLKKYGISTVDDMKAMVSEIFSESYSKIIFESDVFSSVKIDDVIKSYARYYQNYDENGNPAGIMVLSDYDYPLRGSYSYTDELKVYDVEGEVIIVEAVVAATSATGKTKNISFKIRLYEEPFGWKLISPTYVVYNEYSDIYDNLK